MPVEVRVRAENFGTIDDGQKLRLSLYSSTTMCVRECCSRNKRNIALRIQMRLSAFLPHDRYPPSVTFRCVHVSESESGIIHTYSCTHFAYVIILLTHSLTHQFLPFRYFTPLLIYQFCSYYIDPKFAKLMQEINSQSQ